MMKNNVLKLIGVALGACSASAWSAPITADASMVQVVGAAMTATEGSGYIRVVILMTLLSLFPIMLMAATSFTRILIVLSAVRMGLGMQETPPTAVLITLALCLTMFSMAPVGKELNDQALQPYLQNKLNATQFVEKAVVPIKSFMLVHVRESDLALMDELAESMHIDAPASGESPSREIATQSVPLWKLMPAFMLSELRTAFQMAFVVLLPFLLIDLLVAVGLMSLGMMMVPPVTIALPIKILMFVLVDGWAVLAKSLVSGFVQ